MNTKDEITDILDGHAPKGLSPPVLMTQTGTVEQMEACGAYWPDAHYDPALMVRLALQPSELFGFATARVPYDITEEAEALGCTVSQGRKDSQPAVTASPWRYLGYVPPVPDDLVSAEEMMSSPRVRTVIEAAERIHDVRQDLFLTANCLPSGGVLAHMLGFETMIMGAFMTPELVEEWMDRLIPYCSAYAEALSEVSDCVCVITEVQADLTSPEINRMTVGKERRVFDSIRCSYRMIHNCGNTLPFTEDLVSLRPDVLSLETSSDPKAYLEAIGGRCVTLGCINPVKELLQGTPDIIRRKALESSEMGFDLIGPECGVPPRTPNANLKALAAYREP